MKATDIKPGTKLRLRRLAIYASSGATKERESVKVVAEIAPHRDGVLLKFKGVRIPHHRALQSFRGNVDENGELTHVVGCKARYEVL